MDRKDFLIIISLFLTAFLIRAPGVHNVYFYSDEWIYMVVTNKIIANNWVPTAEVFDYSSPFFEHIAAVVTLFFGGDLDTLRMISVIFGSLTVPMLYLFGKALYGRKTGIISALFLGFSAFHSLYSRTIMLDAFNLFFVTSFLYFFWLSQHSENERKRNTYAIIAGSFMGLAIDAKYISLFLVIVVPIYVLWTRRFSFRALIDKRQILIYFFAFLFFLPLLIALIYTKVYFHGMFYYAYERFNKQSPGGYRLIDIGLDRLFIKGWDTIGGVFAWGSQKLNPTWEFLFIVGVILLILIALLFYLPRLIKKEKEGSFLLISLFSFYTFLLGTAAFRHYHIYSLLFYFVMFSHIAVISFDGLKMENGYKNMLRILVLSIISLIIFSYFVTAVTSHYWDDGEYSEIKDAMNYINNDAAISGHKGEIMVGVNFKEEQADYYSYLKNLNISTILIITNASKYASEEREIDLGNIYSRRPDYLLINDLYKEPRYYFKGVTEEYIHRSYKIVYHSKTYFFETFVLKNEILESPEMLLSIGEGGKISQDIFEKSVPSTMKIGKVYTALVKVKNTGDSRTNFTVRFVPYVRNKFIMFVEDAVREITLEKGSTHLFKFKIVPFKEYNEELPITVELYAKNDENGTKIRKLDSVSTYLYRIS